MEKLDVYGAIKREIARQEEKWGEQNWTPDAWLIILMEEVGEASKATLEEDYDEYRKEMVQIAAVAVAALEAYDRGAHNLIELRGKLKHMAP